MNITSEKNIKPLFTIDIEDEEAILKWMENTLYALQDEHKARTFQQLTNRDYYSGIQDEIVEDRRSFRDGNNQPINKKSRLISNKINELVEQWISKLTRFAPAIAVLPANSQEFEDKMNAKLCKNTIDYIFYNNQIEKILERISRLAKIEGESFLKIFWNRDKGDLDPEYIQAKEKGLRIPLLNKDGEPILSEDDEPLYIESEIKVGDIDFKIVPARYLIRQPKEQSGDEEWAIEISSIDVDELKMDYPDKADFIKVGNDGYLPDIFEIDDVTNEIMVYELYHKPTRHFASGRYIKCIKGCVLENTPYPYSMNKLPYVRFFDKEIPNSQFAVSFIQDIIVMQRAYNNILSIAYDNVAQGGHAKWLVQANSQVSVSKLSNEQSVITYQGNIKPELASFNTIKEEIFRSLEIYDREMMRSSGIQDISRGEVPAGIDAGIALSFLEEQENQRANAPLKNYNMGITNVAKMVLAIVGDYYKPHDARMIRIVGKNLQFSVKSLEVAKLSGDFDIRVLRTTALSESKSGRISQLLALQSRFPNMISQPRVLDMLDLADDEKFYDIATMAVRTAELENEIMTEGQPVEVEITDDMIIHWEVHSKDMQSASYKQDQPLEVKKIKQEHLRQTEVMMHLKAQSNPLFAQKIMTLENFPMLTMPTQYQSLLQQQGIETPMAGGEIQNLEGVQSDTGDLQGLNEPVDTGEQMNMEQQQTDLSEDSPIQ